MKKSYIVAIVVVVIVGSAAYFAGVSSGKAQASTSGPGVQFAAFAGRAGSGASGAASAGRTAGGARTFEKVVSINGGNMVVQVGSSTEIVLLTPTTAIEKIVSGSASDITAGESVTVSGSNNSDGSVTANSIEIRPSQPASGTPGTSQNMRSAPMMPAY